jgi:hypothetical protein
MIDWRRRFCARDFLLDMLIALIFFEYTPHQIVQNCGKEYLMAG